LAGADGVENFGLLFVALGTLRNDVLGVDGELFDGAELGALRNDELEELDELRELEYDDEPEELRYEDELDELELFATAKVQAAESRRMERNFIIFMDLPS
jgi:hypothetical protein